MRLPMCLGIIALHCNVTSMNGYDAPQWVGMVIDYLSDAAPALCVPLFFVISGYLTAVSRGCCQTWESYGRLMRRRSVSLLLPYILWNLGALAVRTIVRLSPLGQLTDAASVDSVLTLQVIVDALTGPELVPLWFLRNLFLFYVGWPLISVAVNHRVTAVRVIALAVCWAADEYGDCSGLFYFALGAAAGFRCPASRLEAAVGRFPQLFAAYLVLTALATFGGIKLHTLPAVSVVIVLIGALGFTAVAMRRGDRWPVVSPGCVFFLYCAHGLAEPYLAKATVLLFAPAGAQWLAVYAAVFFAVTAVCLAGWVVLRKTFPRLAAVLTGNRRNPTPL